MPTKIEIIDAVKKLLEAREIVDESARTSYLGRASKEEIEDYDNAFKELENIMSAVEDEQYYEGIFGKNNG